jgi:Rap1a immunity proteins
MKRIVPALLLLGALLAPRSSQAVTETNFELHNTADLVAVCSSPAGDPMVQAATGFCEGFMVGVYQTLREEQEALSRRFFCIPNPPPSRSQAIADFVAWARANPSVQSEMPADAVLHYLEQRFPCAAR